MDVSEFMIKNGPVAFEKFRRAPGPPSSALGSVKYDFSSGGATNYPGPHLDLSGAPVGSTTAAIGGLWGVVATALSVGAAIKGSSRNKSAMRAVGCVGLTFVYLAK